MNLYEAKTQLSALVEQVSVDGEEVIIAKNGVPMAKLVRFTPTKIRKPGGWEGKVWEAKDVWDAATGAELDAFYDGVVFPPSRRTVKRAVSKSKKR
jgi:antitoxin (DNA-binding transcriptional repressor) of toxin-antitoxin stability system